MRLRELLFGGPIPDAEAAEEEQLGPASAVPVLGLDALASAAYGPEAALPEVLHREHRRRRRSLPVLAARCPGRRVVSRGRFYPVPPRRAARFRGG